MSQQFATCFVSGIVSACEEIRQALFLKATVEFCFHTGRAEPVYLLNDGMAVGETHHAWPVRII